MARVPCGWTALALGLLAGPLFAQPASYRVVVRYSIDADRTGRIEQFRELQAFLKENGFVAAAKENAHLDAFDPTADRFEGTVPADRAIRLLADVRIKSMLLEPANAPNEKPAVAQISVVLPFGLGLEQQRQLHEQVVARLGLLGFRESIAYDHVNYTRVRGSLPSGAFASLIKDLRNLPAGWFAPAGSKDELPLPIRVTNPIRIVEWLPGAPETGSTLPPDAARGKFAGDLVAAMADPAGKDKPIRVEMLFDGVPNFFGREIADRVALVCPSGQLEGIAGQSAVVRVGKMADAPGLANLPEVKSLRLPRAVRETAQPGTAAASKIVGLDQLHARGLTGQAVRVAVVATGFPSWDTITGKRSYVDLTGELATSLEASAATGGTGTATALAVRAAAQNAELLLVRIDPFAFHQLITVAKASAGSSDSDALQVRLGELTRDSNQLGERRKVVMEEYAAALRNIGDDEKPTLRRAAAKAAFDKLKADEAAFQARYQRYTAIRNGLALLSGTAVVVNTVVSEVGQPHDGLSSLNAAIGEAFTPKPQRSAIRPNASRPMPVWVQAAGDAASTVWAGPFLDDDGNGAMEFAPPSGKRYVAELAFLSQSGKPAIATGTAIRITAQWREPIDPDAGIETSQFPLVLKLLKQFGNGDEFTEVARAAGVPVRIHKTASAAVFEQTLSFAVPADGRFALRVEGRTSDSIRASRMPSMQVTPRIVIEGANVVFEANPAKSVGVGIPGESTSVITVGTATSQKGAGPGITLLAKPDVLAPAAVAGSPVVGSAVAAGHVGGTVACLAGAGYRPKNLPQTLGIAAGSELKLTDVFLRALPR
jgi:hypothetical protein